MPTKKITILTADDDPQLLRLLTRSLRLENYHVLTATDGERALELIETHAPDVILLDVFMPKMDGFTVCSRVRAFSTAPIIFITVRGQDQDKIHGLNLGADDYLVKPFSVGELLARVRAVLRRSPFLENEKASPVQTIGDLTIDYAQRLVTIAEREVSLTPIEYRLLAYLAQNTGRIMTHGQLLSYVWEPEYAGKVHMLQANISRLRHKIEPDPAHPRYIRTKIGIGYQLGDAVRSLMVH